VIPDSHVHPTGLCPVLFTVWGIPVTSYAAFMLLAVLAAVAWFRVEAKRTGCISPHGWTILWGALLFGSLGAKLLAAGLNAGRYSEFGFFQFLYSGRSILGGLLGGWIGVKLTKRLFGISTRQGNAIAPAAALGIAFGRLGCFFGSCCYGIPTAGPLGVDFGDGQRRHPTQLYEALFALGLFFYFSWRNSKRPRPGILFQEFLAAYLAFRFLIEFIRIEPHIWLGLTAYQILCVAGLFGLGLRLAFQSRVLNRSSRQDLT
jgi:phosphatidylglycerol:prolipoprotein diacylglycerol transferase